MISLVRIYRTVIPSLLILATSWSQARGGQPGDPLRTKYLSLQDQLTHNTFQRPVHLESTEGEEELKGEIYAVLEYPYDVVRQTMQSMENWSDILILHLNVKSCRAIRSPTAQTLVVGFGKKRDEPEDKAFPVEFAYRVAVTNDSYLRILLVAESGPLRTKNYQITFEAVPLETGRTFIHLSYSYDYGLAARVAMKGYLSTFGSGKVGFSSEATAGGGSTLVSGVRGVVERNTMRYYLAIEAYLGSLSAPPEAQLELRLHSWFAATERYRKQLHEVDEPEYLEMKRKEVLRQNTGADHDPAGPAKEVVNTGR